MAFIVDAYDGELLRGKTDPYHALFADALNGIYIFKHFIYVPERDTETNKDR